MSANSSIGHVQLVYLLVRPERLDAVAQQLSDVLEISDWSEPADARSQGVTAVVSWAAGLVLMAPSSSSSSGRWADVLAKRGEGPVHYVVGVDDLDAAVARAKEHGVSATELTDVATMFPSAADHFAQLRIADLDFLDGWFSLGQFVVSGSLPDSEREALEVGYDPRRHRYQHVGRTTHVIALLEPDAVGQVVRDLVDVFGISDMDGPHDMGSRGTIVAVSHDWGIEFMAPGGPEHRYWDVLRERDQGPSKFIFGVSDLERSLAVAAKHGVEHRAIIDGRPLLPSLTKRFAVLLEAQLLEDQMGGLHVTLGQLEPSNPPS